jgi:Na+/H+ antiporter NhaC
MRALSFAVVILFEAWMIGQICQDIGTADYLIALSSGVVSALWLPVLLFGLACLVSFSTGTSWGTMSILLPNVVGLAAAVGATHPIGALGLVVVCIGAVLEGSIFGDHCSPISDTTVLSSVSAASDHIDHVRTQIPYALSTAAVAVLAGYLPTLLFPFWSLPLALVSGFGLLAAALWLFGRPAPE